MSTFENLLHELERSHDAALDRAREDGYSDGYNDGAREGTQQRELFVHALLEKVAARRVRSELPLLRSEGTMTLDEVEQMIREVMV